MITIQLSNVSEGKINVPVHVTAVITSDIEIKNIEWLCNKQVNYSVSQDQKTINFTPSADGEYVFTATVWGVDGSRVSGTTTVDVGGAQLPPPQIPVPPPESTPSPTGTVLYDSFNSKLHNKQVRTITTEGNIECRASGNPRIRVNEDGTFSLLCDSGHGRFYGYTNNYNATMEIECAFWNSQPGQDLSLRLRSRHNEGEPTGNRFGGYGFAVDRAGWSAKREIYHNVHDNSTSGSLPTKPETGKYMKIEFTVKDDGGAVRDIVKIDGVQVMTKTSAMQPGAKSLYDQKSYFWVRSNIDSGTGEIRIKRLRILAV